MFKLAGIFRDQNEEYLVVPVIQKFLKKIGIKVETPWTKADLLTKIENYANSSAKALEDVNDWLDDTLCEGIKEIQIEHRTLKNEMELLFTSEEKIGKYLDSYLSSGLVHHICGNEYDATQYQFVKYSLSTGTRGQVIRMIFCKKMHFSENKTGVVTTKIVEYPIIANIIWNMLGCVLDLRCVVAYSIIKRTVIIRHFLEFQSVKKYSMC